MGSEGNFNVESSPTVQELISRLRSSFLESEFKEVVKMLVDREDHMKELYNELKKKADGFEKDKYELYLENQKLKKKQKEFDVLRKENSEFKDQIQVLKSEKCRVSESALKEELKVKEREIDAMRKMKAEYEVKEAELMFYKKQSTDLHDRVLKLEKTAKELMSPAGSSSISLENKQQKDCAAAAAENSRPPLLGEKGDNKNKTEPMLQEIIQIDDDDDDDDDDLTCISTLKRKRDCNEIKRGCDSGFADNIQTGTQKRKNDRDVHDQPIASNPQSTPHSPGFTPHMEKLAPRNLMSSLDSPACISDPDITKIIDGPYKSIIAKIKMKKGTWRSKADMLEEFDKDDELCMNAICALYRQSLAVIPFYDKSRITELAQLLTDGDPQQKLKKTASELNPSDVDACRRFAKHYAAPIFNIYHSKKDDPFFHHSRS